MRRTRRRSCIDPHTGAILAMAQEPGYDANHYSGRDQARSDARPRGERRLRAGLRVQGRDDRRRALAARHHAEHGVPGSRLPPGRGPRDPRCGAARARDAEGQADPPALVEHRDGHDRRALPRRERPEEVDGALRVRPADRDRLPRREHGHACPRTGRAPRSAPSRSGRASRSPRSSSPPSTRRSRTAASGSSRISSTTSPAQAPPKPKRRRILSPRRRHGSCGPC